MLYEHILNIERDRAIELSEGVSVDAKIHFQVARISPAMKCLTFVTVPLLTKFGISKGAN